jgi:putative transposase
MRSLSTNKTVYSAKYHVIWCPKYRRRGAGRRRRRALQAILAEDVAEVGAGIIEIEVTPEHMQLLAKLPPTVPLSESVRLLKGSSSRLLGMEFARLQPLPVLCSPPWVVSTVGGAPLEVVRRYVGDQKAVAAR